MAIGGRWYQNRSKVDIQRGITGYSESWLRDISEGATSCAGLGISHEWSATWSMSSRRCGGLSLLLAVIVHQSIVDRSHVKCWNIMKWNGMEHEMEWKGMKWIRFEAESWSATRKCFLGLFGVRFYEQLRTREQLGYIVSCRADRNEGVFGSSVQFLQIGY